MKKISFHHSFEYRVQRTLKRHFFKFVLHLDAWLFLGLLALMLIGLFILYSATNQNIPMVEAQAMRMGLGIILLLVFAQIPPHVYKQWTPALFWIGVFLLMMVLLVGHTNQGAKRWLGIGFLRFQPSEFMKIITPMAIAWFFSRHRIPPLFKTLGIGFIMLLIPCLLTAKQPDLGTAILIGSAGLSVIFFAGISWRIILSFLSLMIAGIPILWHIMHDYQKNRVLIFLNPERAPLGKGYHIIQSEIAVGSGGFFGKGWLHGTQSHLSFLPEHATDSIFALSAEELGLIGCCIILLTYFSLFMRCLYISTQAQETFTRLLSASLCVMFIVSALINISMVIGILPVVGVPLPLISYGGSSVVTMMASFGIIMSIHTHKTLWNR